MNENTKKLKSPLKDKCVVFLDILGFKVLVKSVANDVSKAQQLENSLMKIKKVGTAKEDIIQSAEVTIFSDSVVISVDKEIDLISQLIRRLSRMMWTLMCDGIWMRGGCAIGLLSNTSHSPWGPAFIEAYETETRLAIHPRLVFSRPVYDWIATNTNVDQLPIKRDTNDGVYFVDVIGSGISRMKDDPRAAEEFKQITEHLNFGYERAIDSPSVFRKYSWLCREWDRALGRQQSNFQMDLEPYYTHARQQSAGDFSISTLPDA